MLDNLAGGFLWSRKRRKAGYKSKGNCTKVNCKSKADYKSKLNYGSTARMLQLTNSVYRGMYISLGLICAALASSIINVTINTTPTHATSEITIGGMNNSYNATLSQEGGVPGANYFRVPVSISITDMDQYAVGIYLDCDNNSNLNSTQIATCNSNAALIGSKAGSMSVVSGATTLEQMNNEWGFYYDTSKTAEGSTIDPTAATYSGMGTSPSTMAEVIGLTTTNTSNSATEDFSLVFGAKASGNLPAGAYSGNIVVAVTATPIEVAGGFGTITTMQEMNPQVCANATIDSMANLRDTRDDKYYVVGKLADGRCWMLQNLALEGGKTLYPSDSNIQASSYTLPASSIERSGRWNDDINPTGYMYNGNHINAGSQESSVIANTKDEAPDNGNNHAPTSSTGAYYSYMVATAGTGTDNTQYNKASSSICPKGWRLPTGSGQKTSGNGEFQILYEAYNSDIADFSRAFRYAPTGVCNGAYCPYANGDANYWSSTIYGKDGGDYSYHGFSLYMSSNAVTTAHVSGKNIGLSVRCIADNTMQGMTADTCNTMEDGDILNLTDLRDGKSYITGKLADGNCWMLQNLAIDTGTTLKSTDSDVSNDYPIPATAAWSSDTVTYAKNGNHQNNTADTAVISNNTLTANTGHYYSFLAATAGTGTGSSGNASSSICPKGWKLPTGGEGGQFQVLYNRYGNASSFNTAFKSAATGSCNPSYCPLANDYALYWSSTIIGSSYGYYLHSDNSNIYPTNYDGKRGGYSVRCILVAAS